MSASDKEQPVNRKSSIVNDRIFYNSENAEHFLGSMTFKIVVRRRGSNWSQRSHSYTNVYSKSSNVFSSLRKNNTLQNHKKLTNDYILYLLNEYSIFTKLWIS